MRGLSVLAIFITIAPAFADVDVFNTPSGNIEQCRHRRWDTGGHLLQDIRPLWSAIHTAPGPM